MKNHSPLLLAILVALLLAASPVQADGENEDEAHRHLVRGAAAIEAATSSADLQAALDEFLAATRIAPNLAPAWYNLAVVQAKAGMLTEAIASYKKYLALGSDAGDAQQVKDEIIKLEFRQEKQSRVEGRKGWWIAQEGTFYWLNPKDTHITLITKSRMIPVTDIKNVYTFTGIDPVGKPEEVTYDLTLQGGNLSGQWTRSASKASLCDVPGESGAVSGSLDDARHSLTLRHTRKIYQTLSAINIIKDFCSEVKMTETREIIQNFYGPVPAGFVPFAIDTGVTFDQPGKLLRVKLSNAMDTTGNPALNDLRENDEIQSIDGMPVRNMTAGYAHFRLFGPVGSTVRLTILHPKEKTPVELEFTRREMAIFKPDWINNL